MTDISYESNPPFDADIHLKAPVMTAEQYEILVRFRELLINDALYQEEIEWATESTLQRFLIARNYDLEESRKLIQAALQWRSNRKVSKLDQVKGWEKFMSKESESGKIYVPGHDRYGRPVVVFDNTVQNTDSSEDHMNFLAWNLEFATKTMPPNTDKYLIFIHLENFSFFNIPPFSESRETLHMLTTTFPERLGHLIAYKPPYVFKAFYESVKGFLDPKTMKKIVFIYGDVSENSENDILLKNIIGDDWKTLTGAEQPVFKPKTSPGFNHEVYWPTIRKRYDEYGLWIKTSLKSEAEVSSANGESIENVTCEQDDNNTNS
jgi:hypothetical protein